MCFLNYFISNLTNSLIVKLKCLLFPLSSFLYLQWEKTQGWEGERFVHDCDWVFSIHYKFHKLCPTIFVIIVMFDLHIKMCAQTPSLSLGIYTAPPHSIFGIYLTCSLSDLNFIVVLQILQRHWHISSILSVNTCRRKIKLDNQMSSLILFH